MPWTYFCLIFFQRSMWLYMRGPETRAVSVDWWQRDRLKQSTVLLWQIWKWCLGVADVIQYLADNRLFCGWDPQIDRISRRVKRTGGGRREAIHILSLTIEHVCSLVRCTWKQILNRELYWKIYIFMPTLWASLSCFLGVSLPPLPPCCVGGLGMQLSLSLPGCSSSRPGKWGKVGYWWCTGPGPHCGQTTW